MACDAALSHYNFEQTCVASEQTSPIKQTSSDIAFAKPDQSIVASPLALTDILNMDGDQVHFKIIEMLGAGGVGTVYRATDTNLQRDVALKLLRSDSRLSQQAFKTGNDSEQGSKALLDEARIACKLNHVNIVTIYDVAGNQDNNYIVMEWIDGLPLDELIPAQGFPLIQALKYACGIADGLVCAHQHQIVHRDIKPQNIMLSQEGQIKILDFGIAGLTHDQSPTYPKRDNSSDNSSDNKHDNQPKPVSQSGTPNYMAPEQIQGQDNDARSDIFSFGIVLYKMLTGRHPFAGEQQHLDQIKPTILSGDYTPISQYLPDLPAPVIALVDKMLAHDIEQRWQEAEQLGEEINALYQQQVVKKNWWQARNKLTQLAMILPLLCLMAWSVKGLVFPPSTQELIAQQVQEATKIAILPLENISGDPQLQLFNDGLAMSLSSELAEVGRALGDNWVIPASEIRRMKTPSVKAINDKYGADLVLTGSIQHMGSTRDVYLELINGKDGRQLKSVKLSIDAEKLFQGQGLIRAQVLKLLDWTIPQSLADSFVSPSAEFDGAYKNYVQGMGYLYRLDQVGNLAKAEQAFNQAILIDPDFASAYVGLATAQLRLFESNKRKRWLDKVALTVKSLQQLSMPHRLTNFLSGQLLRRKGQYPQAVTLLQNSIVQNPKHLLSYSELARAIEKQGDLVQAEAVYQQATKMAQNNWLGLAYLGAFYTRYNMPLKAIEQFTLLLVKTPNNHIPYVNMAAAYYGLGQIQQAIEYTEQGIKIRPTNVAYSNLGTMYFYQGDYDKAITAYEKALAINDANYIIWGNLADAHRLSKSAGADAAYQKASELALIALSIDPNDTYASALLSGYLANLGNKPQALQYAQRITQQSSGPDNFFVATAYDVLKDKALTLAHLSYAIEKNYPLNEIRETPLLANIKSDEQFRQLLKKTKQ